MKRPDAPVKCCRCRHSHTESQRAMKPHKTIKHATQSVCPRCGATSYYDMTPMVAFCWASGLIGVGASTPDGAIKIAHGPVCSLKGQIAVVARHGRGESDGSLFVPGIPEAENPKQAGDALEKFVEWASRSRSARNAGVVFSTAEVA